jgi:transglutaminase-like putative cysteine protease
MRLLINHTTVYRYDHAPSFSAQVFRLTPRTNNSQHVMRWRVDAPGTMSQWTDAFANTCHTLVVDDPPERIEVRASGEVVTSDVNGVLPWEKGDLPVEVYLRQTGQTEPDAAILDFFRDHEDALRADRIKALHALMEALHEKVSYEPGTTDVLSTAQEAFAAGRGVCQDHAHIFIGGLRALGMPARYVSGYLYDGEKAEPHAAGHAWAAAWVPDLGWVSFDVSNCKSGTDCHVSLAVSLDYDTAAPIRGVRSGGDEGEEMEVHVSVSSMQQ